MSKIQVGDIVKPWGNRATSNKVTLQEIRAARVVKPPKKMNNWDPKYVMVIEILEGSAKSTKDGASHYKYDDIVMHQHYGTTYHTVGAKLIVFVDSFYVVKSGDEAKKENSVGDAAPNATYNATHNTLKGDGILSKNISKRTLLCMLR